MLIFSPDYAADIRLFSRRRCLHNSHCLFARLLIIAYYCLLFAMFYFQRAAAFFLRLFDASSSRLLRSAHCRFDHK